MRPNIRPATTADLEPIATLDQLCFGRAATVGSSAIGGDASITPPSFTGDTWSAATWSDEFARLGSDRVILVADEGEVVGYVVLLVPVSAEDPVDLLRIAVAPAERRTGIGRQLMSAALQRCAGRTVLLEVAESNKSAAELYRGFGFTEISRRRGYYAGGEDAVIMRWQEDHE
ncbi:GNAT family N-acetyltransferase [Kribbella sp. NPDC006257]|uniref:GNAT family N-acetyltransferase n=1 Tax=Kribbella sp. NPDC006257 TaxID=3156738 RepID=UPI0033BAF0C0